MIDTLVLSGGGNKGSLHLGALHYNYKNGYCKDIKIFIGTSIGSVISLLLVCGYTPIEIFTSIYNLDTTTLFPMTALSLSIENIGMFDIEPFIDIVSSMVVAKIGHAPTFLELYNKTRLSLIVSVVNLTRRHCEYWSHLTTPDVSCIDAVRFSCSIPLVFHRQKPVDIVEMGLSTSCYYRDTVVDDNIYYVDGGILNNFPIDVLEMDLYRRISNDNTRNDIKDAIKDNISMNGSCLAILLTDVYNNSIDGMLSYISSIFIVSFINESTDKYNRYKNGTVELYLDNYSIERVSKKIEILKMTYKNTASTSMIFVDRAAMMGMFVYGDNYAEFQDRFIDV